MSQLSPEDCVLRGIVFHFHEIERRTPIRGVHNIKDKKEIPATNRFATRTAGAMLPSVVSDSVVMTRPATK